mmetsp:Transcript_5292/g.14557  ORF Transcript_5292/g.14557 Transcript_5292/m.14557 type:complete len:111 (-) Transcript_5292:1811-2143(-)
MRETSRNTSAADAALTYIFTHTGCRDVGWAWRVFWERSSCCVHVCLCAYVCVCVCVFRVTCYVLPHPPLHLHPHPLTPHPLCSLSLDASVRVVGSFWLCWVVNVSVCVYV